MFYDCHVHVLNIDYVPDEFIGPRLPLSKKLMIHFSRILHYLWPFSDSDPLEDISAFKRNMGLSQEKNYLDFKSHFPFHEVTACIVIMDFFSVEGNAKYNLEFQLQECLELKAKYPNIKIFCGADPNAPYLGEIIKKYGDRIDGFKVYPPLNSIPTHPGFRQVWDYATKKDLPIIAHCGDSGVSAPRFGNEAAKDFSNPLHWEKVLKDFPSLRLSLAHFGSGNEAWEAKIIQLMAQYSHVYTDTAYSIGSNARMARYKFWLEKAPVLADRLLFGSDYFILNMQDKDFKRCFKRCADHLGLEMFQKITEANPKRFLETL